MPRAPARAAGRRRTCRTKRWSRGEKRVPARVTLRWTQCSRPLCMRRSGSGGRISRERGVKSPTSRNGDRCGTIVAPCATPRRRRHGARKQEEGDEEEGDEEEGRQER